MKWLWIAAVVIFSTYGDLASARGMSEREEVTDFHPRGLAAIMRYIITHKEVVAGIAANAISYIALLALLSVAPLSFAIPVTASGYVLKTLLAKWYLGEVVTCERWIGTVLVAAGIALISI